MDLYSNSREKCVGFIVFESKYDLMKSNEDVFITMGKNWSFSMQFYIEVKKSNSLLFCFLFLLISGQKHNAKWFSCWPNRNEILPKHQLCHIDYHCIDAIKLGIWIKNKLVQPFYQFQNDVLQTTSNIHVNYNHWWVWCYRVYCFVLCAFDAMNWIKYNGNYDYRTHVWVDRNNFIDDFLLLIFPTIISNLIIAYNQLNYIRMRYIPKFHSNEISSADWREEKSIKNIVRHQHRCKSFSSISQCCSRP